MAGTCHASTKLKSVNPFSSSLTHPHFADLRAMVQGPGLAQRLPKDFVLGPVAVWLEWLEWLEANLGHLTHLAKR